MPFEKDWRSRRVVHKTPGGKMTRVKISSLPASEQQKYNPSRFDKMSGMAMTDKEAKELQDVDLDGVRTFDFYIGLKDIDDLDTIEEGQPTLATNDSSVVIDLFDDDLKVVSLKNVPVDAVKKKLVPKEKDGEPDYSDIEFVSFGKDGKDVDAEHKFEELKFGDSNIFLLDLAPHMDAIEVSVDDDDETDEKTNEGFYNFFYK